MTPVQPTKKGTSCSSCCGHTHSPGNHRWKKIILSAFFFAVALGVPDKIWLKWTLYIISYLLSGSSVLMQSIRNIQAGKVFDENFLMTIATFGAFAIGEYPEAAAVMLFYQTGEMLQEAAAGKSRRNIVKLMDLRPDFVRVIRNGESKEVNPSQVEVGETITVLPGERIGLDGMIVSGEGGLDASALTGESRPIWAHAGQEVLAGYINLNGTLQIRTQKSYENSAVAKILELTESAVQKKSSTEKFITRFARIYTPAVVCIAVATAVIPPLILAGASFTDWFYRALVFLVVSCPCALVLSVPLGFFGGIGGAAKNGVLVKGSSYLERLAHIYTLALDKTGTLTQGVFEVQSVIPAVDISEKELLSLCAEAESFSNHPVAKAVLKAANTRTTPPNNCGKALEHAGEGIEYTRGNRVILAGNTRLMKRFGVTGIQEGRGTCVYIAQNGVYKGRIELGDKIKPTALEALQRLKLLVRHIVILSGDHSSSVKQTAKELGIKYAYGELLPEGKVQQIEAFINQSPKGFVTAFAGDGINDAPVLARADLGIAMGALGSDAAIEAADVVLMTDDLKKIVSAIRISRRTLRVIKQNIAFALFVKATVLLMGICGLANMWAAVFADVGVSLLAVANSLRPLYFKE